MLEEPRAGKNEPGKGQHDVRKTNPADFNAEDSRFQKLIGNIIKKDERGKT